MSEFVVNTPCIVYKVHIHRAWGDSTAYAVHSARCAYGRLCTVFIDIVNRDVVPRIYSSMHT